MMSLGSSNWRIFEVRVIASEGDAVYMMIMRIHVVYAVLVYTFHC
jgi:hypothetical protein